MKFQLARDKHGFAAGIMVGKFWVIHLIPGTERNEKYAKWIVDRLNGEGGVYDGYTRD